MTTPSPEDSSNNNPAKEGHHHDEADGKERYASLDIDANDDACDDQNNKDREDLLRHNKSNHNENNNLESLTTCPICFDNFADLEAGGGGGNQNYGSFGDSPSSLSPSLNRTIQLVPCGHWFCRDCLLEHCEYAVTNANVPVPCPDARCASMLPFPTVRAMLAASTDEAVADEFQRLNRLQSDPTVTECPFCHALVLLQQHDDNDNEIPTATFNTTKTFAKQQKQKNDLECDTCHKQFCGLHGTSHIGLSCADFHPNTPAAQQLAATESTLRKYTQECSHCHAVLQKSAGCDHIICSACQNDMCWKCGTHVYLTGQLVRHCSKCQRDYRDHRYDNVYRRRMCLCLPVLLPFMLVYMALAATVATLSGCFWGCFRCGRCLEFPDDNINNTNSNKDKKATTRPDGSSTSSSNNGETAAAVAAIRQEEAAAAAATLPRGNARMGISASVIIIFLPIILLLEDFGIHVRILDDLFPEPDNEIPLYDTTSTADNLEVTHNTTTETEEEGVLDEP